MLDTHRMGESSKAKKTALAQASEDVMVAQTMGGRMHVPWDETSQATPHGQWCSSPNSWPRPASSTVESKAAR